VSLNFLSLARARFCFCARHGIRGGCVRSSGSPAAPLQAELRRRGIRTLVFAGVQINVCVEATPRHAHSLGLYCVVPADCVASHAPMAHEGTLTKVRFVLGDVTSLDEVTPHWAAAKTAAAGGVSA
jgi:ureidoacrylate peracid hydrolase